MYYVIVPAEVCERRRVFSHNRRTPDGRVVLTLRDLNLTRFSYGQVELVNGEDMQAILSAVQSEPGVEQSGNGEG